MESIFTHAHFTFSPFLFAAALAYFVLSFSAKWSPAVVPLQPAVVPPLVSGSTAPGVLFHLPSGSLWMDPFAKTFPAVVVLVHYQGASGSTAGVSGSTAGGPAVVPLHPAVVPLGTGCEWENGWIPPHYIRGSSSCGTLSLTLPSSIVAP